MYLDGSFTKTKEIKGINPEYGFKKLLSFNPVTKQVHVLLLCNILEFSHEE